MPESSITAIVHESVKWSNTYSAKSEILTSIASRTVIERQIIDYDKHSHDQVITFEQDVDLCGYAAGTCFHLEVEACIDHDCEEKQTADVEFCLQ